MNLEIIRTLSEKRDGGLKKLAIDAGMSEQNLHRCIRNNKMQASDLETIAILLGADISVFFDSRDKINFSNNNDDLHQLKCTGELLALCKALVDNYQQRDDVMSRLISMVNKIK